MKRMLINATQAEERRLAVVDGQKLLDFEIEIEGREQRKGNIYKAIVTRIEPGLEACFVDYGEERHGFLPFKELSRQYFSADIPPSQARIGDVLKEGQELIVQVEKEERGNKGAALTTFISLAGRYIVLMPNNPRGGGVSRRIEGEDRAELKEAMDQLEYPSGMSVIARTAGIGRTATELQWDLDYQLKLWKAVEDIARALRKPELIYQESNLVVRALRDYFNSSVGEILIDTDDIYEQALSFMQKVVPEFAPRIKRYRDKAALFSRFQIEHQIETAYARTVSLPSGGAIVIDQTEALVAVDVNSARSIRGGDIEETALRTNLEAADEVARQMRLRDLGGLIVIDFIDMEDSKNRREVENRLREALRQDRARVQFGAISKFGLLEMSRQRLKPALAEGSSIPCPRCGGSGHVRDTESSALQILRVIQEEALKDNTAAVRVQVPVDVASFLLNEKRQEIGKIEFAQRIAVLMIPNRSLETPQYRLERLKHDDPRLDQIEPSYRLAEETEDDATVTRRSQGPTNKQTPIIKGFMLPDLPAPESSDEKRAEPARGETGGQKPQPQPPAQATGFWGLLKRIFAAQPAAPEAEKTEDRPERKNGSARAQQGQGRRPRGGQRSRDDRQPRSAREERTEDTGGRGQQRNGRRDARRDDDGTGRDSARQGGQRGDRRNDNAQPDETSRASTTTAAAEQQQPRRERQPRAERGERRARTAEQRQGELLPQDEAQASAALDAGMTPDVERSQEAAADAGTTGQQAERGGRRSRDRYGRDRRSRNARPPVETDAADAQQPPEQAESGEAPQFEQATFVVPREEGDAPSPRRSYFDRSAAAQAEVVPVAVDDAPVQAAELAGEPTEMPAEVSSSVVFRPQAVEQTQPQPSPAAVQAQPFVLPLEDLTHLAAGSGLVWVHSDAEKIAAAQAAIAAEPQPVHVPRERPPAVVEDEGPLVLVETRLDLAEVKLPFDQERAQ